MQTWSFGCHHTLRQICLYSHVTCREDERAREVFSAQDSLSSAGLPPEEAPIIIAGKRKICFSFSFSVSAVVLPVELDSCLKKSEYCL